MFSKFFWAFWAGETVLIASMGFATFIIGRLPMAGIAGVVLTASLLWQWRANRWGWLRK